MDEDDVKKCAHEACNCDAGENDYCSQYCEDAGDTTEISCNCGHVGCAVDESVSTQAPLYR